MQNNEAHPTEYGFPIPVSLPPTEVLFQLVNELKHPINSIDGWTKILSQETYKDSYADGIASLFGIVEGLRALSDAVRVYLMDIGYLAQEKEIMDFLHELD